MAKKRFIVITGTPGIDTEAVANALSKELNIQVIQLEKLKGTVVGYDKELHCSIVDMKKTASSLKNKKRSIIPSHLGHHLPKNMVALCVVLRLTPKKLKKRLMRKHYNKRKIAANMESELLDLILVEAVSNKHRVHEIDTTNKSKKVIVREIVMVLKGKRKRRVGIVDYSKYIHSKNL